jgi:hypothetical protein
MTTSLRQRMLQDLQIAGLSERTQEAYLRAVRQLADHFHTPPDRLSEWNGSRNSPVRPWTIGTRPHSTL